MIAILEDRKGFRKVIDLPHYVPHYDIMVLPPLLANMAQRDPMLDLNTPTIRFYPKGDPVETFGVKTLLYKEM